MRHLFALLASVSLFSVATAQPIPPTLASTDIIVVGAGISGLSAALEAARMGASVAVIDLASVFGGHAVMAEGGLLFAGSPLQRENGVEDSPELAYRDMASWGEEINHEWAKYYTANSVREVHDWLLAIGVKFERIRRLGGNSVARFHYTKGRGLGLVAPLYAACLSMPNIHFVWNTRVSTLRTNNGSYVAETVNLRSGEQVAYASRAIILATGGSQSNFDLLKKNWSTDFPFPKRILLGSGINSQGEGLKLAAEVGGKIDHMDHQWHYPWGLPDPRDESQMRGLNCRNTLSIWVNRGGRRFTNELASPKFNTPAVLQQPESTYWMIFDEGAKKYVEIAGTGWAEFETLERVILKDPKLVKTAPSLDVLARTLGLPAVALCDTIERYNQSVGRNNDQEFFRFGPLSQEKWRWGASTPRAPPQPLKTPPFYGVQLFPLSRKNNGGVQVDLSCNVLTGSGIPIPGLYAVGELTGSGGMNGKAGLEGVWLGPGVALGRVAGREAAYQFKGKAGKPFQPPSLPRDRKLIAEEKSCTECHNISALISQKRSGYWHFEKVHGGVLEKAKACVECHADMMPNHVLPHAINRLVQISTCAGCHGQ